MKKNQRNDLKRGYETDRCNDGGREIVDSKEQGRVFRKRLECERMEEKPGSYKQDFVLTFSVD